MREQKIKVFQDEINSTGNLEANYAIRKHTDPLNVFSKTNKQIVEFLDIHLELNHGVGLPALDRRCGQVHLFPLRVSGGLQPVEVRLDDPPRFGLINHTNKNRNPVVINNAAISDSILM